MYKNLRDLLEDSAGFSQFVIVINIDIRGFTPFCQTVDSADVALFIKKAYAKIIDNYFPNLEFYKPTGDGLLIIIPIDQSADKEHLKEICNKAVDTCIRLLEDFKSICKDEPMINFDYPKHIGIGISRGSACCLKCGDTIIDYSGKRLNLANRLMDLARPSGVVIDNDFELDLLEDDIKSQFESEEVYVRGIAEDEPITIHYIPKYTVISNINKSPIVGLKWKRVVNAHCCYRDLDPTARYSLILEEEPFDSDEVIVNAVMPLIKNGQIIEGYTRTMIVPKSGYEVIKVGDQYEVNIYSSELINGLLQRGILEDMEFQLVIIYPVK